MIKMQAFCTRQSITNRGKYNYCPLAKYCLCKLKTSNWYSSSLKSKEVSKLQKSFVFLYGSGREFEEKIKETIPLATASKRIKYLKLNLTQEEQDVHMTNYKTLLKEVKDGQNKWEDTPCSCIEVLNIVNMAILPKGIFTDSMQSLAKPTTHFSEIEQKILIKVL